MYKKLGCCFYLVYICTIIKNNKMNKAEYRIQNADGTILNAGTDKGSWFTIEQAREIVDRSKGQKIVWDTGAFIMPGEIL